MDVFEDFVLQVSASSITQLVGNNGSGKTTLLKILAGTIIPERLKLVVDGKADVETLDKLRWQMRYVGHLPGLKMDLTAQENFKLDSLIYDHTITDDCEQIMGKWGLSGVQHKLVNTLSFGQQRKLSLLRLEYFPSQVWLLDEPFVGLDQATTQILADLLLKHVQNQGIVILSSHQKMTTLGLKANQTVNL